MKIKNKDIIILVLVLIILIILGYYNLFKDEATKQLNNNIQTETENVSENYFKHNQNCLKYKNEIAKKLETKDSPFGETSLEQIFYSPKQKSCLYVEYSVQSGFYNKRLMDVLNDGYSSAPVEMCSSFYPSKEIMDAFNDLDGSLERYYKEVEACDDFDIILEKYR